MHPETLLISPSYRTDHWLALDQMNQEDWSTAAAIVRDRLHGRFIHFADNCLSDPTSGFVVLSIDCLLMETIQQFIDGIIDGNTPAGPLFEKFLQRPRFVPHFDTVPKRTDFYRDIRCGLLHSAEARKQWRIRRDEPEMLKTLGAGYILNVRLFHEAIKASLDDYLADIRHPEGMNVRANLWTKMNHICNVREQRGAVEEAETGTGTPAA